MPSKLDYLQQKKLNPADELREMLNSLAERQRGIKSLSQSEALTLLGDMDMVKNLFDHLEATGMDLLPERGRFDTIQATVERSSTKLLKAIGGETALAEHRPVPAPDRRERWWWYVDDIVTVWRKRLFKRLAVTAAIILSILGLVVLAFNTILAPSPEAIARIEAETDAFNAMAAGNYADALTALDTGLAVVPDDPDLLVIKGVTYEFLGEDVQAAESFERAKSQLDEVTFHIGRGQIYLRTDQNEKAEAETRAALEINNNLAVAWLLLGQSLEAQGRNFEAMPVYQKAGDIALENGDNEVVVLARMALSRVGGLGP